MTVYYVTGASAGTPSMGAGMSVATSTLADGLPGAIPRDELFYWTRRWREGEQESAAALAAGDFQEFATGRETVRWLLSADDDEE
jgi:hypothetical protein